MHNVIDTGRSNQTLSGMEPVLILNPNSFVPYYEQIAEQVQRLIRENHLKPGQAFYSEAALARQLGISKMPVRQAFQKLRAEGLLLTKRGKTPIIGRGPLPWNFKELHGFSEEMRQKGLVPSAKLLSLETQSPAPEVAEALNIHSSQLVYRMKRLRFVGGDPVAITTSYLPKHILEGFDQQDLEKTSLYYIFEHIYGRRLLRAEQTIGAVNAGHEEAQMLQAKVGSALLHIKETAFDIEETPLEHAISLLRGDRYTASVVSERRGRTKING